MRALRWRRLRAGSGPGDTTADGRFGVWRYRHSRWAVYRCEPGPGGTVHKLEPPLHEAGTMAECRYWITSRYIAEQVG